MSTFERIVPVLTYRDIAAAHDFLVQAFGFAIEMVISGDTMQPDGGIPCANAPLKAQR